MGSDAGFQISPWPVWQTKCQREPQDSCPMVFNKPLRSYCEVKIKVSTQSIFKHEDLGSKVSSNQVRLLSLCLLTLCYVKFMIFWVTTDVHETVQGHLATRRMLKTKTSTQDRAWADSQSRECPWATARTGSKFSQQSGWVWKQILPWTGVQLHLPPWLEPCEIPAENTRNHVITTCRYMAEATLVVLVYNPGYSRGKPTAVSTPHVERLWETWGWIIIQMHLEKGLKVSYKVKHIRTSTLWPSPSILGIYPREM